MATQEENTLKKQNDQLLLCSSPFQELHYSLGVVAEEHVFLFFVKYNNPVTFLRRIGSGKIFVRGNKSGIGSAFCWRLDQNAKTRALIGHQLALQFIPSE